MLTARRSFAILLLLMTTAIGSAPAGAAPIGTQVAAPAATRTEPVGLVLERRLALERLLAARGRSPRRRDASAAASGSAGTIETIAGAAPFQAPITGLKAGLGGTGGVVEDAQGNVYFSSPQFGTVLKLDTASNLTVYAGAPLPTGAAKQSGDGGAATAARIPGPQGLALDSDGNLYIADDITSTVRKVDAKSGVISNLLGTPGENNGDMSITNGLLLSPQSLTFDGSGNLYVADGDSIRKFNLASGVLTTIAGSLDGGVTCDLTATQACPATNLALEMLGPNTIVAGPDGLYAVVYQLVDGYPYLTNAVIKIDYQTGMAQLVAGGGSNATPPAGNTAIGAILGVSRINLAMDAAGNLDLASSAGLIYQLPHNGTALTIIAGTGTQGHSGDGGPATSAMLDYVNGIFATPQGGLVFGDGYYVRGISSAGKISTLAGDGTDDFFGDGGVALQAGLGRPTDTAVDAAGNVYIADFYNGAIRKVDSRTGTITSLQFAGVVESNDGLTNVFGMVADGQNHIYMTSVDGIGVLDATTGVISPFTTTSNPVGPEMDNYGYSGIAFDGNHTLYVANSYDVFSVDVPTGLVSAVARFPSPFVEPEAFIGVALDGKGNLYVSDGICRVYGIDMAAGTATLIAGSPNSSPIYGYTGDGGPATSALLNTPNGLRYDGANHLLIADTGNHAIRSVDLASGIITTVAGTGAPGFTGDGGSPGVADLYSPQSVSVDGAGNLLIADTYNDRVRRVVLHPAALTASLTASSSSATAGDAVTFTATFSGLSLGIPPTLAATFYDGTTLLSGSSSTTRTNTNGFTVSVTSSSLAVGTHTITARFAGDGTYAPVTTAAVTITVLAPIPPSFAVKASPASLTVAQGASGATVFTVTPAGGFNQAVAFSCGSGLPTGVTCSFSPASVTPTDTAAVTTTLTVTTTGATTAGLVFPAAVPNAHWWLAGGGSLACLLMFGRPRRRRAAGPWLVVLLLGVGLLGAGLGGCSSGSTPNANATPPGTYTLKIAATAGTGSSALSEPVSVTLNVTN